MSEFSFPSGEKLKSRKIISALMTKGNSSFLYPVTLLWISAKEAPAPGVQAGFSAPKRRFKLAVDRNLLKRRMREAYRLNKSTIIKLAKEKNIALSLFFIYSTNSIVDIKAIEKSIISQLDKLSGKL